MTTNRFANSAQEQKEALRRVLIQASYQIMVSCAETRNAPADLLDYEWAQVPYARRDAFRDEEGAVGTLEILDPYGIHHTLDWRAAWNAGARMACLCIGPCSLDSNDEAWA